MKYQISAIVAIAIATQVIAQEPLAKVNPAWTKEYDLSKVPKVSLKQPGAGTCEKTDCGPGECEKCWESCGNCPKPADVYGCKAGQWALSFDDGPSEHTSELLDILKAANVKATFLMVGSNVVKFPDVVKRAHQEGHQISQHTWSHPHLMSISNEQIVAEVRATEDAIFNATGVRPAFIRPPYGEADDRVKGVLTAMGYHNLLWNMDTLDWDIVAKNEDPQLILKSFQDALAKGTDLNAHDDPGYISLQHDLYLETVKKVPQIEQLLAQHGFHFVLTHECIDASPYKNNATIPSGNSTVVPTNTSSVSSSLSATTVASTTSTASVSQSTGTSASSSSSTSTKTAQNTSTGSDVKATSSSNLESGGSKFQVHGSILGLAVAVVGLLF
ncbi:glycoside hydrolase/deacetylase [Basidiobolus meristosporus CBS 931.73]|uniref:Glycoside hydrolase/deacetylase n=1 Tax=Basidiobolus meristosporus CBS 931.73 TaxID=1314790 RepID=A0A1Y1X8C8_9FUNG|nr:glycoside hydrolase/deacetylase [Basidiobolus meristosporus CBS 931.73]|eukprot:ORX81958.1 glycoside hydrolase/deacetylase [Basidiobolus meristosporus CBS 931.73]